MSRVQFVETVTVSGGVAGALIPLAGFAATPYVVDINGNEGGQANAYANRQGNTAASSMVTDASGTVSYWLDAGDYNIHFQDQQSPPRISNYIRGFTAPIIDTNQLVVGAQNLIQFTGDTKFSMQASDHGLKPDGSFEWLLMTSDPDLGGRQVDGVLYATLRALLGNPGLIAGKFRLPNVSGRVLIASGAAASLSARSMYDLFGSEAEAIDISKMPYHDHGGATGTGTTGNESAFHNHNIGSNFFIVTPTSIGVVNVTTGGTQQVVSQRGDVTQAASTGSENQSHNHSAPSLSIPGQGGGLPHNNMQPSTGMNLFVKT